MFNNFRTVTEELCHFAENAVFHRFPEFNHAARRSWLIHAPHGLPIGAHGVTVSFRAMLLPCLLRRGDPAAAQANDNPADLVNVAPDCPAGDHERPPRPVTVRAEPGTFARPL